MGSVTDFECPYSTQGLRNYEAGSEIGVMEKKMETTIMRGYVGVMEKKMETTIIRGYIGVL